MNIIHAYTHQQNFANFSEFGERKKIFVNEVNNQNKEQQVQSKTPETPEQKVNEELNTTKENIKKTGGRIEKNTSTFSSIEGVTLKNPQYRIDTAKEEMVSGIVSTIPQESLKHILSAIILSDKEIEEIKAMTGEYFHSTEKK